MTLKNKEKIAKISKHLEEIMKILELDVTKNNLKQTPINVAEMFINQIFLGLDPANKPKINLFKNTYRYCEPIIETEITVYSVCEKHLLPIAGKVHIAYIPEEFIISRSKINALIDYCARRPQTQQRLTQQIYDNLKEFLNVVDIAVIIEAEHLCACFADIDTETTITSVYEGEFCKFSMQAKIFDRLTREDCNNSPIDFC